MFEPAIGVRTQPKYPYTTQCVDSDADSINEMVDQARAVTFRTFSRHCDWRAWAHSVGYVTGRKRGLRLHQDYHVQFFRSRFQGRRCYYVVWSAIEVIFAEPLNNPS